MDKLLKLPEDMWSPGRLTRLLLRLMVVVLCGDFTAGEDGGIRRRSSSAVHLLSFECHFISRTGCGVIVKLCGSPMWVNQSDACHLFSHLPYTVKAALFLLFCWNPDLLRGFRCAAFEWYIKWFCRHKLWISAKLERKVSTVIQEVVNQKNLYW